MNKVKTKLDNNIIEFIKKEALAGKPYDDIAAALNALSYKPLKAERFDASAVSYICRSQLKVRRVKEYNKTLPVGEVVAVPEAVKPSEVDLLTVPEEIKKPIQTNLLDDLKPEKPTINNLVLKFCFQNKIDIDFVYTKLYKAFSVFIGLELYHEAKKESLKPLDYLLKHNLIEAFGRFTFTHLMTNKGSLLFWGFKNEI